MRIGDGVLAMHLRGAAAVLEIIDADFAVEVVADTAEIDPEMRHLVNEERAGIEIFEVVNFLPFESFQPVVVALRFDGKSGRAESHGVEHQRFAVTGVPAIRKKTGFGLPAVAERGGAVERPFPIDAAVEKFSGVADFFFVFAIGGGEIVRGG